MPCQSLSNDQLRSVPPFFLYPNFYDRAWCFLAQNIPLAKSDTVPAVSPSNFLPILACLLMKIFTRVNLLLWSSYYIYFSLFLKLNAIYLKYAGFFFSEIWEQRWAICSERMDWILLALGYLCNLIFCHDQLYNFFAPQKTHFDLLYLSTILFIAFWVMGSKGIFWFSLSWSLNKNIQSVA